MLTAAELIKQLRQYRSDAPINLVIRAKADKVVPLEDGTTLVYGIATQVDVDMVVDKESGHAANGDQVGIFITNTDEY